MVQEGIIVVESLRRFRLESLKKNKRNALRWAKTVGFASERTLV